MIFLYSLCFFFFFFLANERKIKASLLVHCSTLPLLNDQLNLKLHFSVTFSDLDIPSCIFYLVYGVKFSFVFVFLKRFVSFTRFMYALLHEENNQVLLKIK